MLLSNQTDIDAVTPMPTDRVDDTSVVLPVPSETLTWFYLSGTAWASATGQAAGTIVYGKTVYDGILNSSKSSIGSNGDTSVSFAAATRVAQRVSIPNNVFSKIERMSPANQKAEMARYLTTAGDFAVDHRRGRVWANMKATVADDSISYSVKANTTGGATGDKMDLIKIGGVSVLLDGATYTPGANYLVPGGIEIDDPTALATETEGRISNMKGDLSGRLITTLGTTVGGEDLAKDVLKTEQRFTNGRATADALIATGAGFLHAIRVSPLTATPTAGLLTVYDYTAESGTVLYSTWFKATSEPIYILLDVSFGTGLYVGFDATLANVAVGLSYRL